MGKPRSPKGRARVAHERLADDYEPICELDHRNAFELLVATVLSAQSTDERINMTSPALFARFPDPESMAVADELELQELVRSTGFYKNKAKAISKLANALVDDHGGEVPQSMEELVKLPGVGRKTANLVRTVVFDQPGVVVDTHVKRLTHRLGLTDEDDPTKIEFAVNALLPVAARGDFSLRLILHGRRVCFAKKPNCDDCSMNDFCPAAFEA